MDVCDDETAGECDQGHAEKQSVVTLNFNAQHCQMAHDCSTERAEGEDAARPGESRGEKQQRGNEFPNSLAITPPGFHVHLAEDVNGFLRARKFEE